MRRSIFGSKFRWRVKTRSVFFVSFQNGRLPKNKQRYRRPIDVTNRILTGYLPTVQAKNSRLIVTPEVETSIGGSVGSS